MPDVVLCKNLINCYKILRKRFCQLLADRRPKVDRLPTDYRPTLCRPTHRLTVNRWVLKYTWSNFRHPAQQNEDRPMQRVAIWMMIESCPTWPKSQEGFWQEQICTAVWSCPDRGVMPWELIAVMTDWRPIFTHCVPHRTRATPGIQQSLLCLSLSQDEAVVPQISGAMRWVHASFPFSAQILINQTRLCC